MSHETYVMKRPTTPVVATFVVILAIALALMTSTIAMAQAGKKQAGGEKLVVLGDSLVAGYGLGPGESFPEQLQTALSEAGQEILIENAGVSGDTTTGGLARLDWSVPDGTDWVLVELGANDALRGISPEVTRSNLEAIITRLKERSIKVMLAGMLAPPNMGADYEAQFNPIYGELAEKHGVPLYPFFLDGVAADPELNQADGMHPTNKGVSAMVENFLPFLQETLADTQ